MSDINNIVLVGRIGGEPEFKYFESGASICEFQLAVSWYDNKTKEEKTDWFRVKTFNKLAEYTQKGMRICISGRLKCDVIINSANEKKKYIYILADNLQILDKKKDDN